MSMSVSGQNNNKVNQVTTPVSGAAAEAKSMVMAGSVETQKILLEMSREGLEKDREALARRKEDLNRQEDQIKQMLNQMKSQMDNPSEGVKPKHQS